MQLRKQRKNNFSRKNIKIIDYQSLSKLVRMYECFCEMHFRTSRQSTISISDQQIIRKTSSVEHISPLALEVLFVSIQIHLRIHKSAWTIARCWPPHFHLQKKDEENRGMEMKEKRRGNYGKGKRHSFQHFFQFPFTFFDPFFRSNSRALHSFTLSSTLSPKILLTAIITKKKPFFPFLLHYFHSLTRYCSQRAFSLFLSSFFRHIVYSYFLRH